jgi:hypothetical protein
MATLVDSYSESNANTATGIENISGYVSQIAESFTGDGGILNSVKFHLAKYSSPTANMYAHIYAHTGTFGVNGIPTGSPLAVSDAVSSTTLPTPAALVNFTFSGANKIQLSAGTKYFVALYYEGTYQYSGVSISIDSSSPTHPGNYAYLLDGSWDSLNNYALCFYVYRDDGDIGTQVNSQHSAKLQGKLITNTYRSAKLQGKSTSNSSRASKITGIAGDIYSKETKALLPSTVANLEPIYNATEVSNVATDNDVYADLDVITTGYAIHQYKKLNANNTDKIDITWKGKSSVATSSKNVLLQIFNNTSGLWETLDTESTAGVGTKFTLTGSVTTNLSSYYDANNIISLRVYQQFT